MSRNDQPVSGPGVLEKASNVAEYGLEVAMPKLEGIGSPLAFINGRLEANREQLELGQKLNLSKDWHERARSKALTKKLNYLSKHKWHRFGGALAATVGGFMGVAAATALATSAIVISWLGGPIIGLPATILILGGSIVGGMTFGHLFHKATQSKDQDAVEVVARIAEAQGKTPVRSEDVFAALAAKTSGTVGKKMADDLKALTKTSLFNEASAEGKYEALNKLMHKYDRQIRAANGMPLDVANPGKTASEQFADLINSGSINASELVLNRSSMAIMAELERQQVQATPQVAGEIPSSPEMQRLAQNMTGMGIAPVGADVPQDLPKPDGRSLGKA